MCQSRHIASLYYYLKSLKKLLHCNYIYLWKRDFF